MYVKKKGMNNDKLYRVNLPPIGLSVYDMYGKSESEHTLIGGEVGRESSGGVGLLSTSWLLFKLSLVGGPAIVYPRCKRSVSDVAIDAGR